MKKTYFVPVTLDNKIEDDEYYEVIIQVVKKKDSDIFFSQIMSCTAENLLTIEEIRGEEE